MTDVSAFKNNPLHGAGYCLDPEFHSQDHSACPGAFQDLVCTCDKVHGAGSQESGKAQPDWSCAYKAKAGILQKKKVWANAAKMPPEAWYEVHVKPRRPELAKVGTRVLSQVISASSCERTSSAHGQIHLKIRNRLDPATTCLCLLV